MATGRALLSAHDKRGIAEFAKGLAEVGFEILSTGGTAETIRRAGVAVREVADETGFPEMLDGRVKTLHPMIHGGILGRRDLAAHREQMARHGIRPIDVVAVTLYPFEEAVARGAAYEDTVEQIDVGGPSMLRAAAKNHRDVLVVTDPDDYPRVLDSLRAERAAGRLADASTPAESRGLEALRRELAAKCFRRLAEYDTRIAAWLTRRSGESFPERVVLPALKRLDLRYGENPHQRGAFYETDEASPSLGRARSLGAGGLSYTNVLDFDAVLRVVEEIAEPACVIVKHTNPCGAARGATLPEAFERARAGDPVSAFGGVIGFNRMVDADAAEAMTAKGNFFEGVLAPDFEPAALEILRGRKGWGERVRILAVGPLAPSAPAVPPHGAAGAPSPSSGRAQSAAPPASGAVRSPGDGGASAETEVASQRLGYRSVRGGLLVQAVDSALAREGQWRVATKRAPTPDEVQALRFADVVCKHTKSNAIVFATRDEVVGVGAGQMSRVDSVHMAARKAGDRAKGAVMASDAFFPFPDGVEEAARSGITAVLQPGGSVKDADVVAAADRLGLAMVFTGLRHFLH